MTAYHDNSFTLMRGIFREGLGSIAERGAGLGA
jgi:hypothetical protein